jgi:hypothetical protein
LPIFEEVAVRDTTVKRVTTRGGHNIPGQVAPGTPSHCRDCEIELVSMRAPVKPEGCGYHRGRGYCSPCYYRRSYLGQWDGPPPPPRTWKAAELAHEYALLKLEGLTRDQAAERLGVKSSSLYTALYRVRKYAERDRARAQLAAEIAVAEHEAHRINDDMIAYAIRKRVAA